MQNKRTTLSVFLGVAVASLLTIPAFAQTAPAAATKPVTTSVNKVAAKPLTKAPASAPAGPVVVEPPKATFSLKNVENMLDAKNEKGEKLFSDAEIAAAIIGAKVAQNTNYTLTSDDVVALKIRGVDRRITDAVLGIEYVPDPPPVSARPAILAESPTPADPAPVTAEKQNQGCEEQHFSNIRKLIRKCGDNKGDNASGSAKSAKLELKNGQPGLITIPASLSTEAAFAKISDYLGTTPKIEVTGNTMKVEWAKHRCGGISAAQCIERLEIQARTVNNQRVLWVMGTKHSENNDGTSPKDSPDGDITAGKVMEIKNLFPDSTLVAANAN